MKKLSLLLLALAAMSVSALQAAPTYKVLTRDNAIMMLEPSKTGSALKALLPGGANTETAATDSLAGIYRLLLKTENGQESYVFVEFKSTLDKCFITYETPVSEPSWQVHTYSLLDVYNSVTRVNALHLEGELLGMKVQIEERPFSFNDLIFIDGYKFVAPVKVSALAGEVKRIEQEIADSEAKERANKYYLAYLLKSGQYNKENIQKAYTQYNYDEIRELFDSHTLDELENGSRNHDSGLEKYRR